MGWLSDYIGRRIIMGAGAAGMVIFGYPMVWLISTGVFYNLIIALAIYGILLAAISAVLPATLAEMFPFEVRCTAGALGYNAALVLFGGTTPIIVTELAASTGTITSAFWYLSLIAFTHLLFIIFSKETKDNDITI